MPRCVQRAATIVAVFSVCAMLSVHADEPALAQPVQAEPQRVETIEAPAPMTVLVEEVELMLEITRRQAESRPPLLSPPQERSGDVAGGISRSIEIEVPPVVNRTPLFRFEDVTDRKAHAPANKRSADQRRATVEAFRQSLAQAKRTGSKPK